MNREILFRGKRVDNVEWVYGGCVQAKSGKVYIFQGNDGYKIVEDDCCEVNPETVGQFTGLTDKNGTKIFEGDIHHDGSVLLWAEELALFCFHRNNNGRWIRAIYPISPNDKIEITGNIHDNPTP